MSEVDDGNGADNRLPDYITISVERMIRFCHLADLTHGLSSNDSQPDWPPLHLTPFGTMMTLTGSFLFSLFEERSDSINLGRIWGGDFEHPFEKEIEAVEQRLQPFKESLRLIRNRFDFHGSLNRSGEREGIDALYGDDLDLSADFVGLISDCRRLFERMIRWYEDIPLDDGKKQPPIPL